MKNPDLYLKHAAGVYALLAWNEEQQKIGTPTKITKQTLYIHPLTSRFFSLGVSKKKSVSKAPFLAIQPSEAYWMNLIQWDYCCVREKDLHFYIISKVIKGDNEDYPDIPAFAIALCFDTIEKIQLLQQVENLGGREYRQENGEIMINFHKKIFTLPVKKLQYNEAYLENMVEIINYNDLLRRKEQELQSNFSTASPPMFLGNEEEAMATNRGFWKDLNKQFEDDKKYMTGLNNLLDKFKLKK